MGTGGRRAHPFGIGWVLLLVILAGCHAPLGGGRRSRSPLRYHTRTLEKPRPLRIHAVRFDLRHVGYEAVVAVANPDPDGEGPAETRLAFPEIVVSNHSLIAAINTNPFRLLPDHAGKRPFRYPHGWPVDISGLAVSDGQWFSDAGKGYCFWFDRQGRPAIARGKPPPGIRQGAAGFGPVLSGGEVLRPPSGKLAPRSAMGFDRLRRYLWLVVVDGRQPGYSEGMDMHELGHLMRDLGCHEALNLDGGGSSALFHSASPGQAPVLMNRPSEIFTRPIPVMLGVRAVATDPTANRK